MNGVENQMNISDENSKTHTTTVEHIVHSIRKDIINGKLSAGQKLREVNIAEKLNSSRTPVREAFRILQSEGFLIHSPGSGVMVATLKKDEARQLWETRAAIEKFAAEKAAVYITDEQLSQLSDLQRKMEKMGNENYYEYNELDTKWHMLIAEASGNLILIDIIERLWIRTGLIRTWSITAERRVPASWAEHRNVVEALKLHDPCLAGRYLEIHFENSLRTILSNLEKDSR